MYAVNRLRITLTTLHNHLCCNKSNLNSFIQQIFERAILNFRSIICTQFRQSIFRTIHIAAFKEICVHRVYDTIRLYNNFNKNNNSNNLLFICLFQFRVSKIIKRSFNFVKDLKKFRVQRRNLKINRYKEEYFQRHERKIVA